METKVIECIQCAAEFEFSVQDQRRYAQKGYDEPLRCPECRKRKSGIIREIDFGSRKNRKKNHNFSEALNQ